MNFGGQLESATSSDCPWGRAVNGCSTPRAARGVGPAAPPRPPHHSFNGVQVPAVQGALLDLARDFAGTKQHRGAELRRIPAGNDPCRTGLCMSGRRSARSTSSFRRCRQSTSSKGAEASIFGSAAWPTMRATEGDL